MTLHSDDIDLDALFEFNVVTASTLSQLLIDSFGPVLFVQRMPSSSTSFVVRLRADLKCFFEVVLEEGDTWRDVVTVCQAACSGLISEYEETGEDLRTRIRTLEQQVVALRGGARQGSFK